MRTSSKLLDLLGWLKDNPKTISEMEEKFDGRTIASARRRGLVLEYCIDPNWFVMINERGMALLTLEE